VILRLALVLIAMVMAGLPPNSAPAVQALSVLSGSGTESPDLQHLPLGDGRLAEVPR
jgi:hypothetical protein